MSHAAGVRVRERPIDHYKKLAMIKDAANVQFEDDGSNVDRKEKKIVELPIPDTGTADDYAEQLKLRKQPFVRTIGYIRRPARPPFFESDDYCEYDLELEDETWLRNHARWGEKADEELRLPRGTFEWMITIMERLCGQKAADGSAAGRAEGDRIPKNDMEKLLVEVLASDLIRAKAPLPKQLSIGGGAATAGAGGSSALGVSVHTAYQGACASGSSFRVMYGDVYEYWATKRKKLGKPLLRRFWPTTNPSDNNPHHTFRPHEKTIKMRRTRRNDAETVRKLNAMVLDLRQADKVLRWVREREVLKKMFFEVREDVSEQAIAELITPIGVAKRQPTTAESARKLVDHISEILPRQKSMAKEHREQKEQKEHKLKLNLGQARAAGVPGAPGRVPGEAEAGSAGDNEMVEVSYPDGRKKLVLKRTLQERQAAAGAAAGAQGPVPPSKKQRLASGAPSGVPADALDLSQRQKLKKAAAEGHAPVSLMPPNAGYPGFRLGPWAPPQSVSLHPGIALHTEEASVEPEEPLLLGHALGLKTFVHAMPQDVANALKRVETPPVLTSGNQQFPGTEVPGVYQVPVGMLMTKDHRTADSNFHNATDIYYSDLSMQRRYYNLHLTANKTAGGLAWEEGLATGLAAGLGGGVRTDGSGWEAVAQDLERGFLPGDEYDEGVGGYGRGRGRGHHDDVGDHSGTDADGGADRDDDDETSSTVTFSDDSDLEDDGEEAKDGAGSVGAGRRSGAGASGSTALATTSDGRPQPRPSPAADAAGAGAGTTGAASSAAASGAAGASNGDAMDVDGNKGTATGNSNSSNGGGAWQMDVDGASGSGAGAGASASGQAGSAAAGAGAQGPKPKKPSRTAQLNAMLASAQASVRAAAEELRRYTRAKEVHMADPKLKKDWAERGLEYQLQQATLQLKFANERVSLASVRLHGHEMARAARRRRRDAQKLRARVLAATGLNTSAEVDADEGEFTYRFRLGRGGRLVIDRLRITASHARPELTPVQEDAINMLAKRSAVARAQRAGMLRQWGLPVSEVTLSALSDAMPSALSLNGVYKGAMDGSASGRFAVGDPTRLEVAPGDDVSTLSTPGMSSHGPGSAGYSSTGVGAGLGLMSQGAFARASRRTAVTTTYAHAPLHVPSTEQPKSRQLRPEAAAAVGTSSLARLKRITDGSAGAGACSSSGASDGMYKGSAHTPVVMDGLSALFSLELEEVLQAAGLNVGSAGAGAGSSSSSSAAEARLSTSLAVPVGDGAVLRSSALRFAMGLDTSPQQHRNLPRRPASLAAATAGLPHVFSGLASTAAAVAAQLPLPDGRMSEMWLGEGDARAGDRDGYGSDHEEVVAEHLSMRRRPLVAPYNLAGDGVLRPHVQGVQLGGQ